eukprot:1758449-Pleurochrysis_carterae.AAC.1
MLLASALRQHADTRACAHAHTHTPTSCSGTALEAAVAALADSSHVDLASFANEGRRVLSA